jgi:tRNA dimethylallyltransferase
VKGGCVIAVLGPTGVGKTAVAVEVGKLLSTRIISCDSMQVYAGFPALTNQPWSPEDRPDMHRLVGFMDPEQVMSAGEYGALARPLVEQELAGRGWALVAGGSGLYMRAVLAPLAAPGPANPHQREKLEERARSDGAEVLHAELARLDPRAATAIDHRNVRRVIRALESVTSGSRWSGRGDLWEPAYYHRTLVVALSMDRPLLGERIRARTERMLEAGAVDEVKRFREERGKEATRPGLAGICSAIGYGEICRYLDDEQDRSETVEQIAAATRGYARRQATWVRKVRDAVMIEANGKDAGDIARQVIDLADRALYAKEL